MRDGSFLPSRRSGFLQVLRAAAFCLVLGIMDRGQSMRESRMKLGVQTSELSSAPLKSKIVTT